MTGITRQDIDNWAFASAPSALDTLAEEDCDLFDHLIGNMLSDEEFLDLAGNENCIQRDYFFDELCKRLCWVYRVDLPFPFHFSRMHGIMDFTAYESEIRTLSKHLYEKFLIIDRMQKMSSPKIRNAAKLLLDFRHERYSHGSEAYYQILKILSSRCMEDQYTPK